MALSLQAIFQATLSFRKIRRDSRMSLNMYIIINRNNSFRYINYKINMINKYCVKETQKQVYYKKTYNSILDLNLPRRVEELRAPSKACSQLQPGTQYEYRVTPAPRK